MLLNFVPFVLISRQLVCSLNAKLCFAVLKCTKIYSTSLTLPSASGCRLIRRIRDRGQLIDEPNCETIVLCVLEISTRVLEYTQCTSRFSTETRVLIVYILNLVSMRGVFFPGHPAGNSKVSLYALVLGYISLLEYHGRSRVPGEHFSVYNFTQQCVCVYMYSSTRTHAFVA
jgi:hypothetical protein